MLLLATCAAPATGLRVSEDAGATPAQAGIADRSAADQRSRSCRASTFRRVEVDSGEVTGVRAELNRGTASVLTPPVGTPVPAVEFCEVEITVTHGVEGNEGLPPDETHIWVWLPTRWNRRFQAIGGGGTRATTGAPSMVRALQDGYAVGVGDAGVSVTNPYSFMLLTNQGGDEVFNWQLFENWSYRSVHETSVLSEAAIAAYYRRPARYSYWNGCSNGGRQGLEMAQRFPDDFDGIVSAAPALYAVARLNLTMSWPAYRQHDAFGGFIPACKRAAMTAAIIAACDDLDGLVDGLVSNPDACDVRPALQALVGTPTGCGVITQEEVDVVIEFFDGPRNADGDVLWYGHTPGVDLSGGVFGFFDAWWIKVFLLADTSFDWTTTTTEDLVDVFYPMASGRLEILEGSDPVLEPFHDRGGKLLMWHGLADELFPAA
jgi:hypothetical protein